MLSKILDSIKDFFKFCGKRPVAMVIFSIAVYALGRFSMTIGLDIPVIPFI